MKVLNRDSIIVFFSSILFSGDRIQFNVNPEPVSIEFISQDVDYFEFEMTLNWFELRMVKDGDNFYHSIEIEKEPNYLIAGAPALPNINRSIIIPDLSGTQLIVKNVVTKIMKDLDVLPSKGNIPRNIDIASIPLQKGVVYTQNEFFPAAMAELPDPYILRDFRGQVVRLNPFQYNPVTKELLVHHKMIVEVQFEGEKRVNQFHNRSSETKVTLDFHNIYSNQFLNYNSSNSRYAPIAEDGEMLIICYDSFVLGMEPFADWKNQKGIKTTMVPVSEAGSSYSSIKNYVEDFYENNNLAFLLLVGDINQIPSKTLGSGWVEGESDIWYAFISGNDSYPEFFVGRFSAENIFHVQTQVERSIEYEREPHYNASWYRKGVMVASNEGAGYGDDGEADWQHARNMREDLLDYYYTEVDELYDGTQGGADANGNPNSTNLKNALNDGRGIMHYTGHGETNNILTTNFTITNVNALTNDNELPFICTVGCITGNFANTTCLAEAFQRATHNGEPTGGVGSFMSTIYQGWAPPMSAQDEMVDILVESYFSNRKITFGGISFNGCLKMNDDYGNSGYDETDHWTIFGDPSIVLRTNTPQPISAEHPGIITPEMISYPVTISGNGSFHIAALSNNGVLIGAAYAGNDGIAEVLIGENDLENLTSLTLTVTGYNTTTLIETIEVGDNCAGSPEYPDINSDGNINVLDVIILVNFVLNVDTPDYCQFEASDINNDGNLNVVDIVMLVSIILEE